MFWHLVKGALFRQKKKMLLIAFTVALGALLATAMLNMMLDVGDKVNRELKTYGANINVVPKGASLLGDLYGVEADSGKYLQEGELGNIKTIFWAFNIVDFAPYLETKALLLGTGEVPLNGTWFDYTLDLPTGESLNTGMARMKNWWDVQGAWSDDTGDNTVMVGHLLAAQAGLQPGSSLTLIVNGQSTDLQVAGIFTSGSDEDEQIFAPLALVQELSGHSGQVSRVEVSALTTPDNELSRRAAQDPQSLSIKEMETWYCTAYVSAICYQIEEVITDSLAKPIRQVAESEGAILAKTELLMMLITVLSLVGSALGISNLVTASVMERSREIGLLKALGAGNAAVATLVLTEILITGIVGGACGYFGGLFAAQVIGQSVFGAAIDIKPLVIPIVTMLVFTITIIGSIPSIRYILSLHPAEVLHGR
jgi:putative ABC transport system permease protein